MAILRWRNGKWIVDAMQQKMRRMKKERRYDIIMAATKDTRYRSPSKSMMLPPEISCIQVKFSYIVLAGRESLKICFHDIVFPPILNYSFLLGGM